MIRLRSPGSVHGFVVEYEGDDRPERSGIAVSTSDVAGRMEGLHIDSVPGEPVARLCEQLSEEFALCSAIAFAERVREVEVVVEIRDLVDEAICRGRSLVVRSQKFG